MNSRYNYTQEIASWIVVGLIDSDGCLTWSWNNKDGAFIPQIFITSKANREILQFVQCYFGGFVIKNGNWTIKSTSQMRTTGLPLLFVDTKDASSCKLITSKRYDAILLHRIMVDYVIPKKHLTSEGRKFLIDLRNYRHFGNTLSGSKTSQELETKFKLPENSSVNAARVEALQMKEQYDSEIEALNSKLQVKNNSKSNENSWSSNENPWISNENLGSSNENPWSSNVNLPNAWQTLGFFLGDGGIHVIWGTSQITMTLNFTGDANSASSLEMYAASLIQDGVSRKAWVSPKGNYTRIVIHGVQLFNNKIKPFFDEYSIPPCEKKIIVEKLCETSVLLCSLQQKNSWDSNDFKSLYAVIKETWALNPSGPNRKFANPEVYFAHVKEMYKKGKMRIR